MENVLCFVSVRVACKKRTAFVKMLFSESKYKSVKHFLNENVHFSSNVRCRLEVAPRSSLWTWRAVSAIFVSMCK